MQCATAATLTVAAVGADGVPVSDAVIGVLLRGQPTATTVATANIAQRQREFQPAVTAVQTGTSVHFPNFDTVRHHVYSFSAIKRFEIKLYAGTPAAPVVFDRPGVAVLGCNIHDRMTAHVVVMGTPLIARTDAAGLASFELPPGEHRLQGWHVAMPEGMMFAEQSVVVDGAAARVTFRLPAARP